MVLSANPIITGSFTATGLVTNASLANMGAWSFKGNATAGSAVPTDVTIDGLTNKATPVGADELILADSAASFGWKKCTITNCVAPAISGVSSIAGNAGAFTLSGLLTNSTNVLQVVAASKSDQQTGSSATLAVTPLHQQDHDSAVKAWARWTGSTTGTNAPTAGYNVTSVTRSSAGAYVVNFTTAFSASTSYGCVVSTEIGGGGNGTLGTVVGASYATGSVGVTTLSTVFVASDPTSATIVCTGRQ